ncbi:MAG: HAD family phosphatase [Immundisolibacteraceae bacterium]|nr:HAD family phosphatase [Immundisolibacteraceae bacterium]
MAIDTVIFDFDGVIAEPGFRLGLAQMSRPMDQPIEEIARQGMRALLKSGYVTGLGSEAEFWQMLTVSINMDGNAAQLREAIISRSEIRQPMLRLIEKLRQTGITVALLSDHTDWLDQIITANQLNDYFDYLFNSYHLHQCKRDPEVFDRVVKLVDAVPGQTLFIDDNPDNVGRAISRGLNGIVYRDHQQLLTAMEGFGIPRKRP